MFHLCRDEVDLGGRGGSQWAGRKMSAMSALNAHQEFLPLFPARWRGIEMRECLVNLYAAALKLYGVPGFDPKIYVEESA